MCIIFLHNGSMHTSNSLYHKLNDWMLTMEDVKLNKNGTSWKTSQSFSKMIFTVSVHSAFIEALSH